MKRRNAVLAVAAVAAGAAGVGVAWQRSRSGDTAAKAHENSQTAQTGDAALWAMRFDTPIGGQLAFAELRGRPLLLNFWATWCPPCVRELPLLDQFHRDRQAAGWQVIGLAVDSRQPVLDFLSKRPVGFGIGLAGIDGVALSRSLGNSAGALPFSVVFDRSGRVVERRLGVVHPDDLIRWTKTVG